MKKVLYFILGVIPFLITTNIYAECNNEELLNYANNVKIEYKDYNGYNYRNEKGELVWSGERPYSYLLAFSEYRKDVYASTTNNISDEVFKGELIPGYNIYAIGCPNNLDDIIYTVNVYGNENSACPNELIKTVKIKVDGFNEYSHTDLCDKNPDNKYCKIHLNTKEVTVEEFKSSFENNEINPKTNGKLKSIIGALCIIIPLVIVILVLEGKNRKNNKAINKKNRKEKK